MLCAEITGAGQPLRVVSRPRPIVPAGGVLVRTSHGGVCHSDVHFLDDEVDLGAGRIFRHRDHLGDSFIGLVLGHEISGIIEEFGPQVDVESCGLTVGDHVAVYPWTGCQKCNVCDAGYPQLCSKNAGGTTDIGQGLIPGGYGSHVPVPNPSHIVKIPDNIPMHIACMLSCSASTTLEALKKLKPNIELAQVLRPDSPSRLLIVGAGGLGLWCLKLAHIVLANIPLIITVADVDPSKLKTAQEMGADATVVWMEKGEIEEDLARTIQEGCMDAAIDFVGAPRTADIAMSSLMRGGTLVLIGLAGGQLNLSMPVIISKNISIQGVRVFPVSTLHEMVNLASRNNMTFESVEMVKLDEINEVHMRMRKGQLKGRVVIVHN